ncbi:hypothetical protein RGQ29_015286 [Quercus rubra]|uniref:Uncharacterized protein n=1 Tax=Quercus rubra TaxID=3512 RepID=A0AAN7FUS8_QUERU|nr:hypothetical protein RGQ29_015286 [Quercus rubra]
MSSSRGIGNQYLTVILLIAQLSTHIRQLLSFFGVNNASTAHGLILSLICPLLRSLSTCPSPGAKSRQCWISRIGGKPTGSSSGKSTSNSLING